MMSIGARMRARCRQLGISEAEAARRAGVSARRFSFYVNDQREPDFETLLSICRALDFTPNDLFGFEDLPKVRAPSLGDRMRRRMAELGLSAQDAALRGGFATRQFNLFLRDQQQPDVSALLDICEALETTPDHLLGFSEDQH